MNAPLTPADARFAADSMLQSLATWLRLLGYDCLTAGPETGATGGVSRGSRALLQRAVAEGRVFLSRNAHLTANLPASILQRAEIISVAGETLPTQLREIVGRFRLDTLRFTFTRCVECNEPVQQIERAEAVGVVPADVLASAEELRRCPSCGRTFWRGCHVRHSLARLEKWLAADPKV